MSDDDQSVLPASFVALYIDPGRSRPNAPRREIAERHEFCDDMAQMLTETAADKLWQLSVTPADVLQRIHAGLLAGDGVVSAAEARWIVTRLAELMEWPSPEIDDGPG